MANWTLVYGALLMGVISIYVAYYLPKAQSELDAKERAQAIRTSLNERSSTSGTVPDSSSSSSSSTVSNATRTKAAAALQAFVDALEKGAKVSLSNLHLEPSPVDAPTFSGAVITAARDIAAGDVVVQLPASLQFNERTAHPSLRKALEDTIVSNPDVAALLAATEPQQQEQQKSNPKKATYVALLSLLLQVRQQNSSQWGPWLHTLPSAGFAQDFFPLFFSDDEVACLAPFDRQLYNDLIRRKDFFVNVTTTICNDGKGLPNSSEETSSTSPQQKQPTTPSQRLQQMACSTTEGHVGWAFGVFLSREVDLHGVPSMFPLMDMLPYAVDANVRPGSIETNDKGQFVFVNLLAAKDIHAGDRLTFRLGLRHPSDVFLAQGTHDRSHYDPMGVMLPFQWSEAVRDVSRSTIACGEREETIAVRTDRDVHDDLYRCAMIEEVLSELRSTKSEAVAAEVTAAELDEALSVRQVDIASWAPTPAIKNRVRESLSTAYGAAEGADGDRCVSSSASNNRRHRQLMEHNIFLQSVVEMIGSTDDHVHTERHQE